ncbi:MAG: TerB family tellurite resistance protein [Defluviimonas sp.]|nr:TerB family tellurite resistance protein [Paracoccaceae bacterium]MCC0065321.1 TerB family tellurite resistance protein [Defluviimonas sp.]
MFARLLSALLAPETRALPDPDAQLALAALLVRLARADEIYTDAERARIDRVLMARHRLDAGAAAALRAEAEALEEAAPDTVRFTRALKSAVPHEARIGLMEAMWSVALADNDRDPREDAMIRATADLLGVSDVDSARARQHVKKHVEKDAE